MYSLSLIAIIFANRLSNHGLLYLVFVIIVIKHIDILQFQNA